MLLFCGVYTFIFMHLAVTFIQSDLQYIQAIHILVSTCVPWESNSQPLRCQRNALPLSYRNSTYTLTGHFIRYTMLVLGWTPFCLQKCLNSSWHIFNKVLEIFLRDFGPYRHDSIMQLLQICRLHIHDANLPFHHIPKVLYWIEIWWLWRPFE